MSPASSLDGEIWAIAGRWEGEVFDTTEDLRPRHTSLAGRALSR